MATVLGGYQHPVPWVVYACVEELNRTGAPSFLCSTMLVHIAH